MGMSASQARLLTITARIHDVEQQAQSIQNAKIELSTKSDQVYQEYLAALDDTTLTVQMAGATESRTVTATFNNLCSRDRLQTSNGTFYGLRDRHGRAIVEREVGNLYDQYGHDAGNGNTFAMMCFLEMFGHDSNWLANSGSGETQNHLFLDLDLDGTEDNYPVLIGNDYDPDNSENVMGEGIVDTVKFAESQLYEMFKTDSQIKGLHDSLLNILAQAYQRAGYDVTGLNGTNPADPTNPSYTVTVNGETSQIGIYDTDLLDNQDYDNILNLPCNSDLKAQFEEVMTAFKNALYSKADAAGFAWVFGHLGCNAAGEHYSNTGSQDDPDDIDSSAQARDFMEQYGDLFEYYVQIYNFIQSCGGWTAIEDYNGFDGSGDAANNNEWLQAQIECGNISIMTYNINHSNGQFSMRTATVDSDSILNYTTTTTIDKTALAKAEAKYNHDLKEIDKKDKKFDMDLSKLETERNALTTEYDSVKKVIDDNIKRTFGIFS